jgi:hypothetical protein
MARAPRRAVLWIEGMGEDLGNIEAAGQNHVNSLSVSFLMFSLGLNLHIALNKWA